MITLSLRQILDPSFARAVTKLANNDKIPRDAAYRAGRLFAANQSEVKKARAFGNEVYSKYQILDTNGRATVVDGQVVWSDPEGEKKGDAEFEQWLEGKTVDIKVSKFDYQDLVGLSGVELNALAPVIENLPEDEGVSS